MDSTFALGYTPAGENTMQGPSGGYMRGREKEHRQERNNKSNEFYES